MGTFLTEDITGRCLLTVDRLLLSSAGTLVLGLGLALRTINVGLGLGLGTQGLGLNFKAKARPNPTLLVYVSSTLMFSKHHEV